MKSIGSLFTTTTGSRVLAPLRLNFGQVSPARDSSKRCAWLGGYGLENHT